MKNISILLSLTGLDPAFCITSKFKMTLLIFTLCVGCSSMRCGALFIKSIHMQPMKGQVYCISMCYRHASRCASHYIHTSHTLCLCHEVSVFIHSERPGPITYRKTWLPAILLLLSLYLHKLSCNIKLYAKSLAVK